MKRLPIIRHIRYFWHAWRAQRWARMWGHMGIGLGYLNTSDVEWLQKIWRGEDK